MAFTLPDLPYGYNALEPAIDEQTMRIHHDKHHAAYVQKLNAALEGTEFAEWSIERLLTHLDSIPADKRGAVRNNGGGHYNHSLLWQSIAPGGTTTSQIAEVVMGKVAEGNLGEAFSSVKQTATLGIAILKAFGGIGEFQKQFSNAAATRFGSGWAWVVKNKSGDLEITSTANQDNPISNGLTPILGIDVWEHAYYLKYQNRRPEYIKAFLDVVNWNYVANCFNGA